MNRRELKKDLIFVLLSLSIQIPLAIFLGHYYDERVFMSTGYLVSSGFSPYQPYDMTGVFFHPLINGIIPGIGYPPIWPLLLGLIYQLTYAFTSNLILYNFAIKIPVIIGNICLAYLVKYILISKNASRKSVNTAWLFILFNPFILLTTSAWGAFDTVVALFALFSFYFLEIGKTKFSAIIMAISVVLKPIVLPLIGIPLLFNGIKKSKKTIFYLICLGFMFLLGYMPFIILGWRLPLGQSEWNQHFSSAGGMSILNILEIFQNSQLLPSVLNFLGFLWVPALILSYFFIWKFNKKSNKHLFEFAIIFALIFFLTRSWLSETNINLVIPFLLIALQDSKKTFANFHFMWILPLVFMFLNFSLPQLFFLQFPDILTNLSMFDLHYGNQRLIGRFIVTVIWQLLAWKLVINIFRKENYNKREH